MFGIQLIEIFLLLKQIGLALAGAAALWAFVIASRCRHEGEERVCITHQWIADKLRYPFLAGVVMAFLGWLFYTFSPHTLAHEGVILQPSTAEIGNTTFLVGFLFVLVLFTVLFTQTVRFANRRVFYKFFGSFYLIELVFIVLLIGFPAWTGEINARQLFFFGHSAHSIMTVGTVFILDFLFLLSGKSKILKQHIYPLFPLMSKVILLGLAMEFLSVALVFDEAIALTDKFYFMQTLIGILIINGVLLAGPISRRLIDSVAEGGREMSNRWRSFGDVAGTISVISWTAITVVDGFYHLTLDYFGLVGIYIAVILCAYIAHRLWDAHGHKFVVVRGL